MRLFCFLTVLCQFCAKQPGATGVSSSSGDIHGAHNRSRFRVAFKNKTEATRYFSFNKLAEVEAYMEELRARHLTPKAAQLDEIWLVRVRDQGHMPLEATFSSEAAATRFVDKVTEERKRGLFRDYTAAHGSTPVTGGAFHGPMGPHWASVPMQA